MKIKMLTIVFALCLPMFTKAQKQIEVGGFAGFANYQGDLTEDQINFGETKLSYGAFMRYHLHKKLKIRANLYLGTISGNDKNATDTTLNQRGWSFKGNVMEAALTAEFHPFGKERYGETGIFKRRVSPYFATGIGLALVNTDLDAPTNGEPNPPIFPEPEDVDNFLVVPIIAGVRFDFHEHLAFGAEWGWRAIFSDYLDDVGKNGNPDKNDWYMFAGVSLSYFFGGAEPDFFEGR